MRALTVLGPAIFYKTLLVIVTSDKFGVFAMVCAPGWQFYTKDPRFAAVESDIKEIIRSYRNRPCVLAWEAALNETYPSKAIANEWDAAARSEFSKSDMEAVSDAEYGFSWDWPYNSWVQSDHSRPLSDSEKPEHIREYGDWEFGGNQSTLRQRTLAGEKGKLHETWNFIKEYKVNRGNILQLRVTQLEQCMTFIVTIIKY